MRLLGYLTLLTVELGSLALLLGGIAGCQQAVFDGRTDLTVKFMTNFLAGGIGLWCALAGFRGNPEYRKLIFVLLLSIAALYAVLLVFKYWISAAFSYDKEYITVVVASILCALFYAVTSRHLP